MPNTRAVLLAALSSLTAMLFSSCATSSKEYVDAAVAYAVTRGEVSHVRNLNSKQRQRLADGVAIIISEPGCEIGMRLGERIKLMQPPAKSILVYGGDDDYILVPHTTGDGASSDADAARGDASPQ